MTVDLARPLAPRHPAVRAGRLPTRVALTALLFAAVALVGRASSAGADDGRPFGLPFAGVPGPATWYIAQPYGNTVFAFFERTGLYGSGQGVHFGVDFAAPCGTPVLAIGDGVVRGVDGPWGSLPHNLAINHPDGHVSMYGHLLERPTVVAGQRVTKGQPVALSGDMLGTCYSSPHLHLEVRDASMAHLENPVPLIHADWHRILLLGAAPLRYERNLDDPRAWQSIDDQPPVTLGGALLNNYPRAWPADGW